MCLDGVFGGMFFLEMLVERENTFGRELTFLAFLCSHVAHGEVSDAQFFLVCSLNSPFPFRLEPQKFDSVCFNFGPLRCLRLPDTACTALLASTLENANDQKMVFLNRRGGAWSNQRGSKQ